MTKIFLDPGHGGNDPGAVANGLREKDLTLDIAKRIRKYLNDNYSGHTIKMSRTGDTYPSLTKRANDANKWGADVFVSIHINAGGGTGFESFIYNGKVSSKTKQVQNDVHDAIVKETGVNDRGKKRANFAVLRQTNMPAVLTENLFIDTKKDADKLKSSKFLDKVAKGHAIGLAKAFNLKSKKKESKTVTKKVNHTPSPTHKKSWDKAVKKGVFNGKNPHESVTREQLATILDRLKLL